MSVLDSGSPAPATMDLLPSAQPVAMEVISDTEGSTPIPISTLDALSESPSSPAGMLLSEGGQTEASGSASGFPKFKLKIKFKPKGKMVPCSVMGCQNQVKVEEEVVAKSRRVLCEGCRERQVRLFMKMKEKTRICKACKQPLQPPDPSAKHSARTPTPSLLCTSCRSKMLPPSVLLPPAEHEKIIAAQLARQSLQSNGSGTTQVEGQGQGLGTKHLVKKRRRAFPLNSVVPIDRVPTMPHQPQQSSHYPPHSLPLNQAGPNTLPQTNHIPMTSSYQSGPVSSVPAQRAHEVPLRSLHYSYGGEIRPNPMHPQASVMGSIDGNNFLAEEIDRIQRMSIEELRRFPHFNHRGEFVFPWFVPTPQPSLPQQQQQQPPSQTHSIRNSHRSHHPLVSTPAISTARSHSNQVSSLFALAFPPASDISPVSSLPPISISKHGKGKRRADDGRTGDSIGIPTVALSVGCKEDVEGIRPDQKKEERSVQMVGRTDKGKARDTSCLTDPASMSPRVDDSGDPSEQPQSVGIPISAPEPLPMDMDVEMSNDEERKEPLSPPAVSITSRTLSTSQEKIESKAGLALSSNSSQISHLSDSLERAALSSPSQSKTLVSSKPVVNTLQSAEVSSMNGEAIASSSNSVKDASPSNAPSLSSSASGESSESHTLPPSIPSIPLRNSLSPVREPAQKEKLKIRIKIPQRIRVASNSSISSDVDMFNEDMEMVESMLSMSCSSSAEEEEPPSLASVLNQTATANSTSILPLGSSSSLTHTHTPTDSEVLSEHVDSTVAPTPTSTPSTPRQSPSSPLPLTSHILKIRIPALSARSPYRLPSSSHHQSKHPQTPSSLNSSSTTPGRANDNDSRSSVSSQNSSSISPRREDEDQEMEWSPPSSYGYDVGEKVEDDDRKAEGSSSDSSSEDGDNDSDSDLSRWSSSLSELTASVGEVERERRTMDEESKTVESESDSEEEVPLAFSLKKARSHSSHIKLHPKHDSLRSGVDNKPSRPVSKYKSKACGSPFICAIPQCHNFLPARSKWKMCVGCRSRTREYQRKRKGWVGRGDGHDEEEEWEDVDAAEVQLYFTRLMGARRLCKSKNCYEPLPPTTEYRPSTCEMCRTKSGKRRITKSAPSGSKHSGPFTAKPFEDRGNMEATKRYMEEVNTAVMAKQYGVQVPIARLQTSPMEIPGHPISPS
ncbi:hypothetical protein C8Q75DRAFT_501720 [Abortiporus biennis]|nr:hypothetical protein C8Q75DRAFT_501720 [Abortiporus biennis]